jgi:hypothetical protein
VRNVAWSLVVAYMAFPVADFLTETAAARFLVGFVAFCFALFLRDIEFCDELKRRGSDE